MNETNIIFFSNLKKIKKSPVPNENFLTSRFLSWCFLWQIKELCEIYSSLDILFNQLLLLDETYQMRSWNNNKQTVISRRQELVGGVGFSHGLWPWKYLRESEKPVNENVHYFQIQINIAVCSAFLRPIFAVCADMTHSPWENPRPLQHWFRDNFFYFKISSLERRNTLVDCSEGKGLKVLPTTR
jgi:hypothetical protein